MCHSRLGGGKLQVLPCPQCPVSDGRPEKGGLSLRAKTGLMHRSEARRLFDHLVGEREQLRGDFEAERLCGFDVDGQFELDRLLDRQLGRFYAF